MSTALNRWILAAALVVLTADLGRAAATPGTCASAERNAAGKAAAAQLGCHAKATQKAEPVAGACLQKALDKLAGVVAKAEGAGGCLVPGYGDDLAALVASLVADVVNATPPGGFAKCAAAKQKTAGKAAAAKLGCHAKASKSGEPVSAACLGKAGDKLNAAFAKEEDKTAGGCGAFGAAAPIAARVDAFVARVVNGTPVAAPAARCCANGGASVCADLSAANASQCASGYGGTLAGPARVCDGASGDCVEARTETATGCCDAFTLAPGAGLCLEGPGAAAECAVVGGAFHADAKCLPSGACGVADAPGAAGPWAVGHRALVSVDGARMNGQRCIGGAKDGRACTVDSQCTGGGTCSAGRFLPIDAWYPVDASGAFGPRTRYSLSGIANLDSDLAHENAPASAAGARPLLVFSHGSGGIAIQSVRLMERLASHGFVVVAPSHTGNTTGDSTAVPPTSVPIEQALLDRVPDVSFVITHLTARAATPGDPFFGRVDGANVGVAGHSLGGFTALAVKSGYQGILPDARVQAIMPIAPAASPISDAELAAVAAPTLFMTGTLDPLLADEVRAAGLIQASPFNYRADVVGAVHTHFANICDIANALIAVGFGPASWPSIGAGALVAPYNATCIPPAFPIDAATRLQNLYATAFFRRHLLGQTVYDPYLTTAYATANEPDIAFVVAP